MCGKQLILEQNTNKLSLKLVIKTLNLGFAQRAKQDWSPKTTTLNPYDENVYIL